MLEAAFRPCRGVSILPAGGCSRSNLGQECHTPFLSSRRVRGRRRYRKSSWKMRIDQLRESDRSYRSRSHPTTTLEATMGQMPTTKVGQMWTRSLDHRRQDPLPQVAVRYLARLISSVAHLISQWIELISSLLDAFEISSWTSIAVISSGLVRYRNYSSTTYETPLCATWIDFSILRGTIYRDSNIIYSYSKLFFNNDGLSSFMISGSLLLFPLVSRYRIFSYHDLVCQTTPIISRFFNEDDCVCNADGISFKHWNCVCNADGISFKHWKAFSGVCRRYRNRDYTRFCTIICKYLGRK